MQDIAVQFEKHCWIHSVSLFPPQVHVGRSPYYYLVSKLKKTNLFLPFLISLVLLQLLLLVVYTLIFSLFFLKKVFDLSKIN
ncbi:hypothetical protein [Spiroplasma endosymbiont of Apeira syringaria]|uniref:hypothetical protein n=1 Tax=Spiroplasma endosymbiont of Apeira syringaria TaxID=3066307 RepID=UPI0030CDF98A